MYAVVQKQVATILAKVVPLQMLLKGFGEKVWNAGEPSRSIASHVTQEAGNGYKELLLIVSCWSAAQATAS